MAEKTAEKTAITQDAAVDTLVLAALLRAVGVGDTVTHKALGEAIGRNVQGKARYVVAAARSMVLSEGIAFGAVSGVGLKRLDDRGKVDTADDAIARMRRQSRRALRMLGTVENFEGLATEDQDRLNAGRCVFGAVALMTGQKGVAKIAAKVAEKHAALGVRQGIALFAPEGD